MSELVAALMAGADALGVALDPDDAERFDGYRELLQTWNRVHNLVADDADAVLLHKHFIDGLALLAAMEQVAPVAGSLVDIGTGAGLPGLVLKLARPELAVTLVESNGKRARFLEDAAEELGLDGVEVCYVRAEELGQDPDYRESHDWATARRLGEVSVVLEYALPLVAVGGQVVLPRGEEAEDDIEAAAGVPALLGGGEPRLLEVPLPPDTVAAGMPAVRRFAAVGKQAPTPEKYPRAPGRPTKRPLRA